MVVYLSILLFVEEEVFFGGVVGPDVFDAFVGFAFVFDFLKVLYHFEGRAAALGVVDELLAGCGPWCVFEFRCEFKCPIHSCKIFLLGGIWSFISFFSGVVSCGQVAAAAAPFFRLFSL